MSSTNKFDKISRWLHGTGMPNVLSAAKEHQQDKAPDMTLVKPPPLKQAKKLVKI